MPFTREDFEPDLGGLFDDFDSPVMSVEFGSNPNPEYAKKSSSAENIGVILELDSGGEKPIQQWYSIGGVDQWDIQDGGKSVVRTKNPEKHAFHGKSKAWALVSHMILAVGAAGKDIKTIKPEEVKSVQIAGQDFFIKREHAMTEGAFYTGLNFHWKQQDYTYTDPDSKEEKKTTGLFPDKFLGEVEVAGSAQGASTTGLDELLVAAASGKSPAEVKKLTIDKKGPFAADAAYVRSVVNGTKLAELEKAGSLTLYEGKYL